MTFCRGVLLPRDMDASIFVHTCGGRGAAVFADGAENADPDFQEPGGHIEGKSVVAMFALLEVNGQTSREDVLAVEAEVPALNTTPVIPEFHEEDMYDSDMEVPRGPVNHDWLNVVIAYSHGRKYDGLSILPQALDKVSRLQQYKYRVEMATRLCQGPRVFETNKDMVATQCAVHLCEGNTKQVVIEFSVGRGRFPLKKEKFSLLDQQAGITSSDSESE
jgi:hypothetical protein